MAGLVKRSVEVVGVERYMDGNVCVHLFEAQLEHDPVATPIDTEPEFARIGKGVGVMVQQMQRGIQGPAIPRRVHHILVLSAEEFEKMPLTVGQVVSVTVDGEAP